ncbi:MAG: hypothetical protein QM723_04380 [Myxococcaceae bacterium]
MSDLDRSKVQGAIDGHDAIGLSQSASDDQLSRLKTAEEVLGLVRERKREVSRWSQVPQLLVGVVAVAGMLVNAYQSYENKQSAAHTSAIDQERWSKEFVRAQRADKYRAFFETSVLATDPANPDKRLVGYALLQEFVDDEDYNSKATLMLEESLLQELRGDPKEGLDEAHRSAVIAIVTALSQSNDCRALERAARTIDRVALHHAASQDVEETTEVFRIYARRLMGRGAVVCRSMKEFSNVRRPLMETLVKLPEVAGLKEKPKPVDASARLAQILGETCYDEVQISGASDCWSIADHYLKLCADEKKPSENEAAACAQVKKDQPNYGSPPLGQKAE